MAEKTVKLNATKFAYVRQDHPTTHYTPSGTTWYQILESATAEKVFFLQIADLPNAVKHRQLIGVSAFVICARNTQSEAKSITAWTVRKGSYGSENVDIDTITYNSIGSLEDSFPGYYYVPASSSSGTNITFSEPTDAALAKSIVARKVIRVWPDLASATGLYLRATLANGTSAPYVTLVYDDAIYYDCSVQKTSPSDGATLNPGIDQTFKWALYSTDPTPFSQKSAVFHWRATDGSAEAKAWHSVNISGNTTQVTIPGKTFPHGRTIQYYITVVDDVNRTLSDGSASEPYTVTMQTVTPLQTAPASGTTVDPTKPLNFSWTLTTPGSVTSYDQDWANLRWTDDPDNDDRSTWNSIAGITTEKSYTAPAYTFPSGKTIRWSVLADATEEYPDNLGWWSGFRTFTTLAYELTLTQYPSGNNVCSGNPITVAYDLKNSSDGDARQTSAKLYWRTSTADPYTVIQNSGATKALTIPANTIPTGATVQWYIEVTVSDGAVFSTSSARPATFSTARSQITPQSSPTSGYINPRLAITFSWYFAAGDGSVSGTASLFWKVSTGENYTEVAATGNSVTIPANTFPVASTIQWYLAGQDYSGQASQTSVFEFSTAASSVRAIPNFPVNGTVDGSQPITFEWTFESADGYQPSRVEMAWKLPSEDSQHWHVVVDTNNAITEYTVAENTFSPGQIDWRVRAWNIDSVQGQAGTASFVNLIAPSITVVTATSVPFSTISWQVNDQQSYEIMVDENRLGPYFGTEKRFELPYYLEDGVHQIKVRVMGSLGMWSQWKETGVSISNISESSITLTGSGSTNAVLQWSTESAVQNFYVYRDNTAIARTNKLAFTDKIATGEQTYFVINKLSDGNYDKSNEVTVSLKVDFVNVSSVDGSKSIEIIHTLKSKKNPEFKKTLATEYHQLSGRAYPFVVSSSFLDEPVDISAVFLYNEEEERKTFESLFGTAVVVKTPDGSCFVGFIDGWQKKPVSGYYTSYTLTIRRIDWEDFIDDTE